MLFDRATQIVSFGVLLLTGCGPRLDRSPVTYPERPLAYPQTATVAQIDDYHGTQVADPYRWLEDTDSEQTAAWVAAQNKVTFAWLDEIPARPAIKERLTHIYNYERYTPPFKEGGRYFYQKNDGLQNQNVYYTLASLDAQPQVLIDPNTLSPDGTVALKGQSISRDGKLMAYGLSTAGSDWEEWKVREVETTHDRSDQLRWIKFSSAAWTHDGEGFFYSRYDEPKEAMLKQPNYYQKLFYHRLGTPQSQDILVYERPDEKEWGFSGTVTDDGRYLIVSVWKGAEDKNRLLYKDLQKPDAAIVELIDNFDAAYAFIDNDGPVFWFRTDLKAPRGRIIAIDTSNPAPDQWKEIVPQTAETLESVDLVNDMFICSYLKDAHSVVKIHGLDGKFVRDVKLPALGTTGGFSGKRKDKETFYSFTSFTYPTAIYHYDVTSGTSTVFRQPKVDFDPGAYETKQVFYTSKDGTRAPMFITHKRGLKLDGNNPTYLYGYGGFNATITPWFSASNLVWMEMGGVFAVATLRGGGEYGEEWHQAGTKLKKQNVFDDFISAAEWLIANQFTRREKLAIGGGSNGGLLVGACITQRPDLFGAALPDVGVMDMLRFQKFTIGWAWVSDYGSSDDPEEFKALYAYSPLHNIRPGTRYPATMVTTADHDDRVVPGHSFKFAAALQAAQAGEAPALIRIQTKAGHGAGKPISKIIEEAADRWAFLVRVLDVPASVSPPQTAARTASSVSAR